MSNISPIELKLFSPARYVDVQSLPCALLLTVEKQKGQEGEGEDEERERKRAKEIQTSFPEL